MRGKYWVYLALGIVLSGVSLIASFRNVPLEDLAESISRIDPWYIALSAVLSVSTLFLRAIRWQAILFPVKRTGFWNAYHPLAIAFSMNCILPGRMGELARPLILHRKENLEFSRVLATVVAERLFDIFTLLLFFVFIVGSVDMQQSMELELGGYLISDAVIQSLRSKTLLAGIVLFAAVAILMTSRARMHLARGLSLLPGLLFFLPGAYRKRVSSSISRNARIVLDNISTGLEALRRPAQVARCAILSLLIWLVGFLSFFCLIPASGISSISFLQASVVVIFICFFIMLPSVPGYWGIWEVAGIYGLVLFGVNKAQAAGVVLVHHALQVFPLIILGLISAWIIGMHAVRAGLQGGVYQGEDPGGRSAASGRAGEAADG
ncbi:MAG: lysylphosphatidylglycerol synthase transmembrane domain-containing protein [Desulfomonilia bacterium]